MMKSRIGVPILFGLALAGAAPLAGAEDFTEDSAASQQSAVPADPKALAVLAEAPQPTPEPPAIQTDQHGTRYLSGGVTLEERDQMRGIAAGQFPLRIYSAAPQGNFVPDVAVTVTDTRGRQVLAVPDAGPVVYVKLPPGKYRINADNDGKIVTREVVVTRGRMQEVGFYWPGEQPG